MTKALREMQGKYIGNRPVKVRKSTWKERSVGHDKVETDFTHSLAMADKSARKGLATGKIQKDKRFQRKKPKNGLPW